MATCLVLHTDLCRPGRHQIIGTANRQRSTGSVRTGATAARYLGAPLLPSRFHGRNRVRRRGCRLPRAACRPLAGTSPSGRNRALRSVGPRRSASVGSLGRHCGRQGFNCSQPPVPLLGTLGYKLSPSLLACAASQITMFSTPPQRHVRFELRCTRVAATVPSVSSVRLPSMSRRRANRVGDGF